MTTPYKPSQVELVFLPLVGTMKHAEVEYAAALIVRVCQVQGDAWKPVTWKMVQEVVEKDRADGTEPIASLVKNPFFRPDVHKLISKGYASWEGPNHGVELTNLAFEAMRKWVRAPTELAQRE